ncbi:MAG: sulfatase, partial [Planctomycetaceae bacterium]|nr:sulfatase [Planctomycetaceae bacterium]
MIRPSSLILTVILFAVQTQTETALAADSRADRPNIILINIDDLGYGDIGPFGSRQNATPNLDRMATEGRRLTSHYAAPVCSPSRASLMTGCYPKRAMPIQHVLFPSSAVGLHPDEVTIAELLKGAGYVTGCIGKWHLGDQPPFLPTRQGFDYYFGLPYSNDMGNGLDGSKSNPGRPLPKRDNVEIPREFPEDGIRGAAQPPLPLLENERVIEQVDADGQTTLTARYAEKARGFIRDHRDESFFLYLPHTAVHFPLYPGMKFRGKSGNGLFSDWVTEVDWAVGQIFEAVRENQIADRTLIIFTSDNGGARNHGANNDPLRGQKGQTFEGGIRVPTIVWWPGRIPAGTSTAAITSTMDFLPTLAQLGGAAVPTDRRLDGLDIWPVMEGTADAEGPRSVFHYFRGFQLEAVRSGDWKLHLAKQELYNLKDDIGESRNVADEHADVVKALNQLAAEMNNDLGNQAVGPGCRPLGRVDQPQPLISHDGIVRSGFEPQ